MELNEIVFAKEIVIAGSIASILIFLFSFGMFFFYHQNKKLRKKINQFQYLIDEQETNNLTLREQGHNDYLEGRTDESGFFMRKFHTLAQIIYRNGVSGPDELLLKETILQVDERIADLNTDNAESKFIKDCVHPTVLQALTQFEQSQNGSWLTVAISRVSVADENLRLAPYWQATFFRLLFALVNCTRKTASTTLVNIKIEQFGNKLLMSYSDPSVIKNFDRIKQLVPAIKELTRHDIIALGAEGVMFNFPLVMKEEEVLQ